MNFTEWKAEAMRLADNFALSSIGVNPCIDAEYAEVRSARAALEAHLEALPMGAADVVRDAMRYRTLRNSLPGDDEPQITTRNMPEVTVPFAQGQQSYLRRGLDSALDDAAALILSRHPKESA